MISLRARSVCVSPSKTSTPPLPVSRAVPLIQSILFFLNRNSTPLVRPVTTRSLRACTCAMSMPTARVAANRDAPLLRVLNDLQRVRVLEQRLGRDAAPQQAGAAERLLLLDDRDLEAELRGADGGHVAAGAGADDDDVVFVVMWSRVDDRFQRTRGGTNAVRAAGRGRRSGPPAGRLCRARAGRPARAAARARSAAPSTTRTAVRAAGRAAARSQQRRDGDAGRPTPASSQ